MISFSERFFSLLGTLNVSRQLIAATSIVGMAIMGLYLFGGKAISWIRNHTPATQKVNEVAAGIKNQLENTNNAARAAEDISNKVTKAAGTSTEQATAAQFKKSSVEVKTPLAPIDETAMIPSILNEATFKEALNKTPAFDLYNIKNDFVLKVSKECVMTGVTIRPANLFYSALFKGTDFQTVMPGKGLFSFYRLMEDKVVEPLLLTLTAIKNFYDARFKEQPDEVVSFSAKGSVATKVYDSNKNCVFKDVALENIFGSETYNISNREIAEILDSQRIYLSPMLPLPFYSGIKLAMLNQGIVELPGDESHLIILSDLKKSIQEINRLCGEEFLKGDENRIAEFLKLVEENPEDFGFASRAAYNELLQMTIYQIGSLVVKTEDYRLFVDGNMQIRSREVGQKDAFRLINACGIRGYRQDKTPKSFNRPVANSMFQTALLSAESGIVLAPAVGMGVWKGDPDIYWREFLNAVIASGDNLTLIAVNPNHGQTDIGKYQGCSGKEFSIILEEFKVECRKNGDEKALRNLNKVIDLVDSSKDLLQLAHNLKVAYPDITVSILNASDPDVTFGYHVGEYVNGLPHRNTTEENYSTMGLNLLCNEIITGIHHIVGRVIQSR